MAGRVNCRGRRTSAATPSAGSWDRFPRSGCGRQPQFRRFSCSGDRGDAAVRRSRQGDPSPGTLPAPRHSPASSTIRSFRGRPTKLGGSRAVQPFTWWPRTRRPHLSGESAVLNFSPLGPTPAETAEIRAFDADSIGSRHLTRCRVRWDNDLNRAVRCSASRHGRACPLRSGGAAVPAPVGRAPAHSATRRISAMTRFRRTETELLIIVRRAERVGLVRVSAAGPRERRRAPADGTRGARPGRRCE
jgi:hypothetical protein